jgi:hypothetical protein
LKLGVEVVVQVEVQVEVVVEVVARRCNNAPHKQSRRK